MKAIIPVAGAGTKLRPHSNTQPKALIPLAGRTVLSIIIDQLKGAGIEDFVFVIGYLGDKIQDYVKENYPSLNAQYVQQIDRQGIGHAILLTKDFVQDDEVIIVLGDTICEYNVQEVIYSPVSILGLRKVDDPRDFGVAELNENGQLSRVVEKPNIPKSNLAMVGIYKIKETALLFECLAQNIKNQVQSHGVYNLTDALDCMIKKGASFNYFKVENWYDCGRKETLLETNALLLKKLGPPSSNSYISENVVIIPPVSIGNGCKLQNSIIGPNVTIGDNSVVKYSIVQNSIIGSYSNLDDIVLESSLIGSDTSLMGESRSLNVGDNSSINLGLGE